VGITEDLVVVDSSKDLVALAQVWPEVEVALAWAAAVWAVPQVVDLLTHSIVAVAKVV
tara:strand:+ start:2018 stop:2191 length:174 start_codon:yes stop_codon:yes gene_type:complete